MGLFANVPNLVLGALSVILLSIFLIGGGDGVYAGFLIFNTIMRFHSSMWLGVITDLVPSLSATKIDYIEFLIEAVLFTVLPLVSVGVTHLAYTLGSKEKKIFSFLSGKK
jgi:predicted ABC-type exoprotein transport system permease subunit